MEPISVGKKVHYHGSHPDYHGLYEVEAHHTMDEVKQLRPDIAYRKGDETDAFLAESYPDGVSYDLWPVGVSKKYGNRYLALYGARRDSITEVAREGWDIEKFRGDIEL